MGCPTLCSSPTSCLEYLFPSEEKTIKSQLPGWKGGHISKPIINQSDQKANVWAPFSQDFMQCHGELLLKTETVTRAVGNLPEKESKIAQVNTGGGTDLLLKWFIIKVFLPQNRAGARDSKAKHTLNDTAFLSESVWLIFLWRQSNIILVRMIIKYFASILKSNQAPANNLNLRLQNG